MADNTQATTPVQNTEPEWKQKADKMKKQISNGLWVQLAYVSDANHNCEPVLLSEKQETTVYPIVVEEPTGFINPKRNWHTGKWEETNSDAMSAELSALKEKVDSVQGSVKDMADNDKQKDQRLDQLVQLVTMTNANVGQIMQVLNKPAKPATPAQSTKASQPQQGGNK